MSHIVIAVVDDMFFASKIRAVAEAVGTEISFPRSKEALMQKVRETKPRLVIVDLHNQIARHYTRLCRRATGHYVCHKETR